MCEIDTRPYSLLPVAVDLPPTTEDRCEDLGEDVSRLGGVQVPHEGAMCDLMWSDPEDGPSVGSVLRDEWVGGGQMGLEEKECKKRMGWAEVKWFCSESIE